MFKEKIAVIIPTKDRGQELKRLLECMAKQDINPEQVVVVDGGSIPVKDMVEGFKGFKIDYVRKIPASLTAQRNAGVRALRHDITLVSFFDDDILLEEGAIRAMYEFWEDASDDTGGAAFNIANEIYKKPSFLEKFFIVNDKRPSRILRSGFQSRVSFVRSTTQVDWLAGCSMVWRRDLFGEFMFDERFSGYARYEEVDFSYRVGKKYKLFIVAEARVAHLSRNEDVSFSYSLGRMEAVNRFYFVKKNRSLSKALCLWALGGMMLNNFVKGLLKPEGRYIRRGCGNLRGLLQIILSGHGMP